VNKLKVDYISLGQNMISTAHTMTAMQCECATESAKIHQELVVSKKSQADLVETVLSNIDGMPAEEKIQIISELQEELADAEQAYVEKEAQLKHKIKQAIDQLHSEIMRLTGADAGDQQAQIKLLSQDLLQVQEGNFHAVGILFRRYGIAEGDLEMQNEVLEFVNSIERAEKTYQCITDLQSISGGIMSAEERIQGVLKDVELVLGVAANDLVELKGWRARLRQWRVKLTKSMICWLNDSLPKSS
jgi:hypothetical protein